MLKRVRISGYRSCADVTLDNLGFVTALIGRNAAGKTNILKAVEGIGKVATSTFSPGFFLDVIRVLPRKTVEFSAEADVEIAERLYRYELKIEWSSTRSEQPSGHFSRTESLTVRQADTTTELFRRHGETITSPLLDSPLAIGEAATLAAFPSLLSPASPLLRQTEQLRPFFQGIRYYPLPEATQVTESGDFAIQREEYEVWLAAPRRERKTSRDVALEVIDLFLRDTDRFQEFTRLLGNEGLNLLRKIVVVRVPAGPAGEVYIPLFSLPEPAGDERGFPFSQLSQGTRRIIRLLLAMLNDDASVMLIEHPEDNIHKGLVPKLIGLLKSAYCSSQVILTTHSDTVMNALEPQDIRFVSIEDGNTTVRSLAPDELRLCSDYVQSDKGISLSDYVHSMVEE